MASETVLVVDDEESILGLVKEILVKHGYQVLTARNSDEALDISSRFKDTIHLLLTDVKMDPSMTGYQLAQCMRLMRVEIKVLYISGYVEDEMIKWEMEYEVAGFLPKPIAPDSLLEKVRQLLVTSR